jgi:tyrosine-specific transport protein
MVSRKHFWYAIATFVGTVIGVGMFGLPYVGSRSGYWIFLLFMIGMSCLAVAVHIFYAEVALKTKGLHRLPGYAGIYFNPTAKRAAFILQVLSLIGSLLAYLIVGGQFLAVLFSGSVYLYTFIFFILGALIIWRGSKSVGSLELILLFILIAIILILFFSGVAKINPSNLNTWHLQNFFVPYGIVLFSLWGTSIIPDVKEMVGGDRKQLRQIIIGGIIVCSIIYLLFSTLVIGVSGTGTTQEAIAGLRNHLGSWVVIFGLIAGIIATFTSFITLGLTLEKTFRYDYGMAKWLAWLIACFLPLTLYIIGLKNFIDVVGLNGAVMLGLEAVMITLMYLKIKKKELVKRYTAIRYGSLTIVALLIVGVLFEVYYFFNKI